MYITLLTVRFNVGGVAHIPAGDIAIYSNIIHDYGPLTPNELVIFHG